VDDKKITKRLSRIGIEVNSIFDLVNTSQSYSKAIPELVEIVGADFENIWIREGVVRALAVKEAKGLANGVLLKIYEETSVEFNSFRWAIGNTFSIIMLKKDIPEVLEIVKNKENKTSRQMFVSALGKFKGVQEVEDTLLDLLDDEEVIIHVISALRKIASDSAYSKIEKLAVFSERSVVRKEARKYLDKMNNI